MAVRHRDRKAGGGEAGRRRQAEADGGTPAQARRCRGEAEAGGNAGTQADHRRRHAEAGKAQAGGCCRQAETGCTAGAFGTANRGAMTVAPAARAPGPPVPLSVLTGFLGAGKTSLLNRLLRDPAIADTAVIINEFGEIGLDHLLVE